MKIKGYAYMKRNEFAKKHKLTYDTIRHYIDMELLIPKLHGSHYYFGDKDNKDIETIQQLKQLDFTLSEIQRFLTIQRIIDNNSKEFIQLLLPLYEEKLEEIDIILEKYNTIESTLKNTISNLKAESIKVKESENKFGFPMSFLALMACPRCDNSFNFSNGKIEHNSITDATLLCDCGYHALIQDGIYIDTQHPKQKKLLQSGAEIPSTDEYLQVVSPKYVNFQHSAMSYAVELIKKYNNKPQSVLELNFCIGAFLTKYNNDLHCDTTYILVDYDLERIKDLRRKLALKTNHEKFVFICSDIDLLPIKKASLDVIVDDWMPKCYVPSNKQSITEDILPFLKDNGFLVGFYHYIDNQAKHKLKLMPNVVDYYNKDKLLEKFTDLKLNILENTEIGPVDEYNPYNSDVKDIDIYQTVYIASKKISPQRS